MCCGADKNLCKCPDQYYNDHGQCVCKELLDPTTGKCISRLECLWESKHVLGNACLQYNGCQIFTTDPNCLDRNQLVQCNDHLCPRSVGCNGTSCDVYEDNDTCQANCSNNYCTNKTVRYFDITNDGYIWF